MFNFIAIIIPFIDDPKTLTKAPFLPFPWLTIPLVSSSLYALSSTFDPLKFLETFLALTLFTLLRASSLKATLMEEEKEFKEEAIIKEEEKEIDIDDSCDDSLLSESMDETSASEESDEFSDGSISDEESLIELDPKKPFIMPTKCGFQDKYWSDYYQSVEPLQRKPLMDLLAEIYEEENMIEIDITFGSIKCPRFEIEA